MLLAGKWKCRQLEISVNGNVKDRKCLVNGNVEDRSINRNVNDWKRVR